MEIVKKIQEIRETKKIARKDIANFLCISPETYRDIEYGKIRLSLDNYLSICSYLNLSPMELLNNNPDEHFILFNKKDIEDLNRITKKINLQTQSSNQSNINLKNNKINNFNNVNTNNSKY